MSRRLPFSLVAALAVLLSACADQQINSGAAAVESAPARLAALQSDDNLAIATFAGGCFWCMERPFERFDGVEAVISGFAGGTQPDPTYDEVAGGQTDHLEAVQVFYDPEEVSYQLLLNIFWRTFDPTDAGGQFADRGDHYTSAIFAHDAEQHLLAEASKADLAENGPFDEPIVTPIREYTGFYAAEDYHQDFYKTNPERYGSYAEGSGRKPYLRRVWGYDIAKDGLPNDATWFGEPAPGRADNTMGTANVEARDSEVLGVDTDVYAPEPDLAQYRAYEKPPEEQLREMLTPIQYRVTQEDGTERPFDNPYWDNKEPGIYVDLLSGEPLFSSTDKFRSGTGWPSFTRPLEPALIVEKEDRSLGMVRTEVRSKYGDNHLGHVFDDGPAPTGLRYCMNSAALRFIPVDQLEAEGYGQYLALFEEADES